jgi:hypothetical protein
MDPKVVLEAALDLIEGNVNLLLFNPEESPFSQ